MLRKKAVEFKVGDIVSYHNVYKEMTYQFKIVEIDSDRLHIKMIDEPCSSQPVPKTSIEIY